MIYALTCQQFRTCISSSAFYTNIECKFIFINNLLLLECNFVPLYFISVPKMALPSRWTTSVIIVLMSTFSYSKWPFNKETRPRTGQFKRLEYQTVSLQIRCHDAYYMLSYLRLTNPQYYGYPVQVETLHRNIDDEYSEWARKMLANAFNFAFQDDTKTDVAWLLFLYVERIKVHANATRDPLKGFLPVLRTAHYGMYMMVFCTMFESQCTMFEGRKFADYVGEIKQLKPTKNDFVKNRDAVLGLLNKHWPDVLHNYILGCCHQEKEVSSSGARRPTVQPLTDGHFTKDLLSLNDVFENAKAVTLLTDFGVFGGRDRLIGYLNVKINEINSGNRSFGRYVLSLVDFHEHVQRAFLTTMLRIYYVFLEKLKTVDKDRREEHVKLFLRPYNDWCDFLNLPKKNNGFYVTFLHDSWDCVQSEIMLARIQKSVIGRLLEIDNESNVPLDNHTAESLRMIDIDESLILTTMSEYKIPLDSTFKASEHLLKEDARPTVLCAEALVAFMKSIFTGVDFRAIKSLVKLKNSTNFGRFREYEQLYDVNVFARQDEPNSFQVCGSRIIRNTV